MPQQLMTARDVKRTLRCSLSWVYKAADVGLLPHVRIPCSSKDNKRPKHLLRFRQEDILQFMQKYYQSNDEAI